MSLPTSEPPLSDCDDGGGSMQRSLLPDTESPAVLATPVPIVTALDIEQKDNVPNPNSSHNVATTPRQDTSPQASGISSLSPQRLAPRQHPTNELYSPMSCHEQSYCETTAAEVLQANLPSRERTEEPSSSYLEKRQDGAAIAEERGLPNDGYKTKERSDHICGCQSQKLTGWAAVEKTLTDYDSQEVGGYKEDIDSLLTFAGLYSGILTAFVIVSFTQLQEDTAAESLKVLRIIANQTAGNPASSGQATGILDSSSSFEPSLAAKRVNVLWFASLVISLSTASLAILVKQWLRAYMSFASSSAQGQLRIREFRRSGLKTWRVFGIASMLPLLLQISLALFFVGLCFFTNDIDPVIGHTTLPLVCAWAFFFTTFTLSPIFSARCPYKTPALLEVTTKLRVLVWYNTGLFMGIIALCAIGLLAILIILVSWPIGMVFQLPSLFSRRVRTMCMRAVANIMKNPNTTKVMDLIFDNVMSEGPDPPEELDILKDGFNDLTILVSADATQASLELDITSIEDALKESLPKWDQALDFLHKIIANRIPSSLGSSTQAKTTPLVDCTSLSAATRDGLYVLLRRYVVDNFHLAGKESVDSSLRWDSLEPTKRRAICIFVALYNPSTYLPDARASNPLIDVWLGEAPWRLKLEPWHRRLFLHVLALLCVRITQGYTTTELPKKLENLGRSGLLEYLYTFINPRQDEVYLRALWQRHGIVKPDVALGTLYKKAAQCLANDMFTNLPLGDDPTTHGHSVHGLSLAIGLCTMAKLHGVEAEFEDTLAPFVKKIFARKLVEQVWSCLMPCSFLVNQGSQLMEYHQLVVNCLRGQSSRDSITLPELLCRLAASPCADILEALQRSYVALALLNCEPRPLRLGDQLLWRQGFLNFADALTAVVKQDETRGDNLLHPLYFEDVDGDLIQHNIASIGHEVDTILSADAEDCRNSKSLIPDYFCLTLGRLTEIVRASICVSRDFPPEWTAKHLHGLSREEKSEIMEEGAKEAETVRRELATRRILEGTLLPFGDASEEYGHVELETN